MLKEISVRDLLNKDKNTYTLVDIRDEEAFAYGHLPGAINMPSFGKDILPDENKNYIIYGNDEKDNEDLDHLFQNDSPDICFLKNGYKGWIENLIEHYDPDKKEQVERSLIKTYHLELLSPFLKALDRYEMLKDGDKVAVCISGGKDSMLMAKLFQELLKFSRVKFECVFLIMDPGYSKLNRELIEKNAKELGIPAEIFETRIFDAVDKVGKSPCYLCARMRRGHLYNKAKELGCNKIALGHHYDDVIETIFMGLMYGGQIQTMMPKVRSTNFEGMELIRPLYLVHERDIIRWRDANELYFIQCACHFTEDNVIAGKEGITASKRLETKKLIAKLKRTNPYIEQNIFKSVENVCLDSIVEYKHKDVRHNFLEDYDKE